MSGQISSLTEEHVTRMLAKTLAETGHEIIAVHPPDGQGPFVIPKPKVKSDIERSSFHPDVVSVSEDKDGKLFLYISECKLKEPDLQSDRMKLATFASDKENLLYALFRCQKFPGGPEKGFDFESLSTLSKIDLPIRFILAAGGKNDLLNATEADIGEYQCTKYLFSSKKPLSS